MNEHETEFQDLIEQLGQERPSAPEPNRAFTTGLRGQLLGQYEQKAGWEFGRLVSTATALAVLALVVFVGWFLSSSQQQPTIAGEVIQTTREAETAVETNGNVIHTTLQVSKFVDETYTWNATVEHWQTASGRLNRTLVADENGQLDHFAQNDGVRLYIGNTLNPIYSLNRRLRSYYQFSQTDTEGIEVRQPPFYSDLGWDGLADKLVQAEWDCPDQACLVEQFGQPPLGVSPDRYASGEYGWSGSLVSSEDGNPENSGSICVFSICWGGSVESSADANGRLQDTLIINYSLEDGVNLPQYRQVKIDPLTYRPLAIFDFDGDKLLRSIEIVNREQVNMPLTEFQTVPDVVEQTVLDGYVGIVDFGAVQLSGFGWDAWLANKTPLPLTFHIFWQAAEIPREQLTGFIHILDQNGGLVAQNDTPLQWDAPTQAGERFTTNFIWAEQLPSGRYQVQVGVYDAATGQRLTTSEGETAVQVDELVIDGLNGGIVENQIPFGDNVALSYSHVIQEATADKKEVHILRFLWYARQTPTENLTAFVHLVDENGQVMQQQDQELVWTVATGAMVKPGFTEYALQSVEIAVPDGRYQVQVGLYDGSTGQRVTTTEATVQGETAMQIDHITIGQ